LRKQSHVESSNTIIFFIEAILDFWRTKSKEWLKPYLPQHIYDQIELEGPYIDGVNKVINHIFQSKNMVETSELLTLKEDSLMEIAGKIPEEHKLDIERVALAISFYKLLNEKYCTNSCDIEDYSARVQSSIPLRLDGLRDVLSTADTFNKLFGLL
ncbi:MAG: hypothetical protein KAJ34_06670, partial [Thermodesulfovibrionia bacterium]|nr:hypothetical protein [Thermodesulfovibrionia bacterium]